MADNSNVPSGRAKKPRRWHPLLILLAVMVGILVYAYGFEKTNVTLEELGDETRQERLVRVLRALARPELLTYERIETNTDVPFFMPCPADGVVDTPELRPDERQISVEPACGEPGVEITVTGRNFAPFARATVNQVPPEDDLNLKLEELIADEDGDFVITVDTRERPDEEQQWIRVLTREPIGSVFDYFTFSRQEIATGEIDPITGDEIIVKTPRISEAAKRTWDKIVETVFMAFLATSLGVLIAVPLSFTASRNLMRDVATPITKLALQIIALPIGVYAGIVAAGWARWLADQMTDYVVLVVIGLVVIPVGTWLAVRWALPPLEDTPPGPGLRAIRAFVLMVAAVAAILTLFLAANLLTTVGANFFDRLASFDFIAKFVANIGDILAAIITLFTALIAGGVLMNLAGKLGSMIRNRIPAGIVRLINLPLAAVAGGGLAVLIGLLVGWLYRLTDPITIIWIPGTAGAVFGLLLAFRALSKDSVGIGLTLYYIARTIFNTLRSIEPLVMVIVIAVWVGLGAFAGTLALALHTVAALAKLYSEQVESIQPGPVEAVRATGSTRIQTIAYSVLPQVVPPYISFTLYRWDINVRLSTIIGFAGGGGIGFLLQQNIRLLNYRAASVNMLAIVIVVSSLDYLSSRIRERIV